MAQATVNGNTNGASAPIPQSTETTVETDLLIIGAGAAGVGLACFLAQHGLKGIMVASTSSTANTPKAHITNMAASEYLRDIGLEKEYLKVAAENKSMQYTHWC